MCTLIIKTKILNGPLKVQERDKYKLKKEKKILTRVGLEKRTQDGIVVCRSLVLFIVMWC